MTKYRVLATMSVTLETTIEVNDDADPWEVARETDGADLTEIPNSGDWIVYDVSKID